MNLYTVSICTVATAKVIYYCNVREITVTSQLRYVYVIHDQFPRGI